MDTKSKKAPAAQESGNRVVSPDKVKPSLRQRGREIQKFGEVVTLPIGLPPEACRASIKHLNQLLADTATLRDMYKKHHWQVTGPTFYQLHLLFDKHYEEQSELVDTLAERIQALGGVSIAMGGDNASHTRIEKPPMGREEVPVQISRLLEAHEQILTYARTAAEDADEHKDVGTGDFLAGDFTRTNEIQVWFVAQHLVDTPLLHATDGGSDVK